MNEGIIIVKDEAYKLIYKRLKTKAKIGYLHLKIIETKIVYHKKGNELMNVNV